MVNVNHIQELMQEWFRIDSPEDEPFVIHDDGAVSVQGDVTLTKNTHVIPVKFRTVSGAFIANYKSLHSLQNGPESCHKLSVIGNQISDLTHVPSQVITLNLNNNLLSDFTHMPTSVENLYAFGNPLTSLVGLLESDQLHVNITHKAHLPLLRLTQVASVHVGHNLGGLTHLKPVQPLTDILNRHSQQGKAGAIKAAAELIRAGYKDNARW